MMVVGVDGGGTRTRSVALTGAGTVHAWAVGGAGNYQMIGPEGLGILLAGLLADMGVDPGREKVSLTLALAGAGRKREQNEIVQLVKQRGWAAQVSAVSDARAALEGAHGGAPGIIVIAGTGSIVLGKRGDGKEGRAGGWGPLLDDEGSGYCLGLEGLRAVFRARDGCGPQTRLETSLRAELGLGHWDELVGMLYSGRLGRDRIAALAPLVMEAADHDEAAAAIVTDQGGALGRKVAAVAGKLSLVEKPQPVACAGGVFRNGDALWFALARKAGELGVVVRRRTPLLPPVFGAALLAWNQIGRRLDEALIQRLSQSAPDLP